MKPTVFQCPAVGLQPTIVLVLTVREVAVGLSEVLYLYGGLFPYGKDAADGTKDREMAVCTST